VNLLRRFFRRFRREKVPAAAPGGLRIEPLAAESGFRLSGELDLYTVDLVREALEPDLHGTLVFDLSSLEFIDDTGLGFLIGTFKRLRREGGSLVLRNPHGHVLRVLQVTGIDSVPGLVIEGMSGDRP
jgi:anti-anti-sigma factor